MKKILMFLCTVTLLFGTMGSVNATVLFFDDFTGRGSSNTVGGTWSELEPGGHASDAKINSFDNLVLKHNAAAFIAPISTIGYNNVTIDFDWKGGIGGSNPVYSGEELTLVTGTNLFPLPPYTFDVPQDLSITTWQHRTVTNSLWDNLPAFQLGWIITPGTFFPGFGTDDIKGKLDNITITGDDIEPEPVPEPTTILLMGIGVVGLLGGAARQKLKKKAVDKS